MGCTPPKPGLQGVPGGTRLRHSKGTVTVPKPKPKRGGGPPANRPTPMGAPKVTVKGVSNPGGGKSPGDVGLGT